MVVDLCDLGSNFIFQFRSSICCTCYFHFWRKFFHPIMGSFWAQNSYRTGVLSRLKKPILKSWKVFRAGETLAFIWFADHVFAIRVLCVIIWWFCSSLEARICWFSWWVNLFGMDYSGGNVVHVIPGTSTDNWPGEVWATEDEYRAWNNGGDGDTPSNSSYDQRQSQSRSGSEPPNKKSRNSQDVTSSNRSKAIGKMFFKTKLCCKFRAGTCPYITNCNFAHSIEELRRPPPNWQVLGLVPS